VPDALSQERMEELLAPFLRSPLLSVEQPARGPEPDSLASCAYAPEIATAVPPDLTSQLTAYLDLLLRWNARTNLTAIRNPEEMVQRHFGESLFAGRILSVRLPLGATLLDIGSGAGFPGLPIQLLRPDLRVTLAESQGKKASFLREAIRALGLSTEVFPARVETMPEARRFDAATLRAVDNMELAVRLGIQRVVTGGWLAALGDGGGLTQFSGALYPLPCRSHSFLELARL